MMLPNELMSVEEELAACRAAFAQAGTKVGDFVWLIHHKGPLIEVLLDPIEDRILYILSNKPEHERARRLREMRPVMGRVPTLVTEAGKARDDAHKAYDEAWKAYDEAHKAWKAYVEARNAYDEAWKAYDEAHEAWKAYVEARNAHDEAWKAYVEAHKAYDEAWKAYVEAHKAWKAYVAELSALHLAECPWTAWDGNSIFGSQEKGHRVTGRRFPRSPTGGRGELD